MSTGTLYERRNRYRHLNTIATTVVAARPAHLVRVNVNTDEAGAVVNVYDSLNVDASKLVASIDAGANANTGTLEFDIPLSEGLTVDVTVGATDITVVYN